jgi:hypothetical protein
MLKIVLLPNFAWRIGTRTFCPLLPPRVPGWTLGREHLRVSGSALGVRSWVLGRRAHVAGGGGGLQPQITQKLILTQIWQIMGVQESHLHIFLKRLFLRIMVQRSSCTISPSQQRTGANRSPKRCMATDWPTIRSTAFLTNATKSVARKSAFSRTAHSDYPWMESRWTKINSWLTPKPLASHEVPQLLEQVKTAATPQSSP